ncbi:MAG: hypothetical protein ACFHXK_18770 [bacterium]
MIHNRGLALLFAITLTSVTADSFAEIKINKQEGPYVIQLSAGGGSGYVEAAIHDTSKQLMLNYSGKCQAAVNVVLVVLNGNILQAHLNSGAVADLQLEDIASRMSALLTEGCPSIETISVYPSHLPAPTAAVVLQKADNWAIAGGSAAKAGKAQIRLSQLVSAVMMPEGVSCNDPADILIDTQQRSFTSGQSGTTLRDYIRAAANAAKFHEILCPGTDSLRIYPDAIPEDVVCNSAGGDCYLKVTWNPAIAQSSRRTTPRTGTREDLLQRAQEMVAIRTDTQEWVVEAVGYSGRPEDTAPDILDFSTMIDYLARGDYSLIRSDYNSYFRLFHNQFLFHYSEQCSTFIADPVTFNVTLVEETVFGDGFRSGPRQVAPTYQLTLDREFETSYRRYETANKAWMTEQIMRYTVSADRAGGGGAGVSSYVSKVMSDKDDIGVLLQQGCNDNRVQQVYRSLKEVL